jgi:hypothetical protein
MKLTAVRVIRAIIGQIDGALGRNVWYVSRDVGPYGPAIGVVREQRRRCPCRGEVVDGLGYLVVRLTLYIGICDIGRG